MKENLKETIDWILDDEAGFTTEHGLGGATNHGITRGFLSDVRKKQGRPAPSIQDVKNLTKKEAAEIYEEFILSQVEFNRLPAGLDYVMANTATMEGITGAKKLLQKVLGLKADGKWEEETWKAIDKADPELLAGKVLLTQIRDKMKDSRIKTFGTGWANRAIRVWDRASELINKDVKQGD